MSSCPSNELHTSNTSPPKIQLHHPSATTEVGPKLRDLLKGVQGLSQTYLNVLSEYCQAINVCFFLVVDVDDIF